MRKIIVLSFITLDGVMQAPGGPEEDTSDAAGELMQKQMKSADLLLGRKTFEIFAAYWPEHADFWPGINDVTKYVLSNTIDTSDWENSVFLKDVEDIQKLKSSEGSDIQVHGSGELIQLLLKNDLVDELWLKTFPVILGTGKKLFAEGIIPAAFTLTESFVTPNGVIFANYKRAGKVKTALLALQENK
jgi:dihydrofolate reductase